jgi:hypothetical protein
LHDQHIRIVVVTGSANVWIDEEKVAAVMQKPVSGPRPRHTITARAVGALSNQSDQPSATTDIANYYICA